MTRPAPLRHDRRMTTDRVAQLTRPMPDMPAALRFPSSDVAPPPRYPRDGWAPEGDEYYVAPELRGSYAAVTIPAPLEAQFLQTGSFEVAEVFEHDAAIERADRHGKLRGGVLSRMSQLICDPEDTIKEYTTPDGTPRYQVTSWRLVPAEVGLPRWRHAIRLQRATLTRQGILDQRNKWLANRCQTCGNAAADLHGTRCHVCAGIEARLDQEQELIGEHTRLEYILARRAAAADAAAPQSAAIAQLEQPPATKSPARRRPAVTAVAS